MRGPTASSRSNPVSRRRGFRPRFSRTSRPARTGRDLDAQRRLAIIQALPKMHRISIRCRNTVPLSTRHSDLGQVSRGVDIGRQFSIAASAPPGAGASVNTAQPYGESAAKPVPGTPFARTQLCASCTSERTATAKEEEEETRKGKRERRRRRSGT